MFRVFSFFLKFALFSLIVLVLGNWVRWDGKTISDQVKLRMSHAEDSGLFETFKGWTDKITQDAQKGFQKKIDQVSSQEEIPSSERQKLKALIRELNSTHKKD